MFIAGGAEIFSEKFPEPTEQTTFSNRPLIVSTSLQFSLRFMMFISTSLQIEAVCLCQWLFGNYFAFTESSLSSMREVLIELIALWCVWQDAAEKCLRPQRAAKSCGFVMSMGFAITQHWPPLIDGVLAKRSPIDSSPDRGLFYCRQFISSKTT